MEVDARDPLAKMIQKACFAGWDTSAMQVECAASGADRRQPGFANVNLKKNGRFGPAVLATALGLTREM